MKRKLTSILLMSALLVGGASTFVSCKDYDGDQAAATNATVKGLSDEIQRQIAALEALKADINSKLALKADQSGVDGLSTKVSALEQKIDDAIANLQAQIDNIQPGGGCSCDLTELLATQAYVNSVKSTIDALVGKDLATKGDLEGLLTAADLEGYLTAADIEGFLTAADLKDLQDAVNNVPDLIGAATKDMLTKADLADYVTKDAVDTKIDTKLENYVSKDNFAGQMIQSLNDALAGAGLENVTNVYDLFKYIDEIAKQRADIDSLSSVCADLVGQYAMLNDRIEGLVTGVNVDMIDNPIYGTLNTPFGLKSYVLAGFVGGEIPTTNFCGETVKGLAHSGNGGSVYLTVNPSNINAEGWNIGMLVGRDGSYAPGYGPLVLSADNTPVTTRATNGLGGYVATPELVDPASAKINIDREALTEVAKNVLGTIRRQESFNIKNAASTIYNSFANAIDQYYAINVKYGENGEYSYTSPYDIAAVTVKPLSYETLKGKSATIPSIPQIEDVLGINLAEYKFNWDNIEHVEDMEQSITLQIPDADNITIDGSNINPDIAIDESKLSVKVKVDKVWNDKAEDEIIDTVYVEQIIVGQGFVKINDMDLDNAVVSIGKKDTTIYVTVKMDQFNDMIDNINSQVGGMLGTVNDLVDKVQGGVDKINNSVIARLNKVISKVNRIANNPNAVLQPVMLYSDANGAGRLSESALAPTRFNLNGKSEGSIVLAPISYNADLLAPAFKKCVTVEGEGASVDVDGVFDGGTKKVVFTAKPGKYTITYNAMDYYGITRTKKYYVEVK